VAKGGLRHGGHWRHSETWPPTAIEEASYYLCEGGVLSRSKPEAERSSTAYTYDPANTVSSNGRCIIAYGPAANAGFAGMGPQTRSNWRRCPDTNPGRPIADRPDVLVFQTAPLGRISRSRATSGSSSGFPRTRRIRTSS